MENWRDPGGREPPGTRGTLNLLGLVESGNSWTVILVESENDLRGERFSSRAIPVERDYRRERFSSRAILVLACPQLYLVLVLGLHDLRHGIQYSQP